MKKIYLSILLVFLVNMLIAQTFQWAKREGLWAYDYGYGITTDNAGNVYTTGKYELNSNFSGTTVGCEGNHDIFLTKYAADGSLSWVRTAGGVLGDYATGISTDGTDWVYIAGEIEGTNVTIYFEGSGTTLTSIFANDIFLAKYDLDGNLAWAKHAGWWHNEKALGITHDNAGNVYICGYYNDTTIFDGSTYVFGTGGNDVFIAKYDPNGNFLWVKTAGSSGRDEAKAIRCDAAGNIYICGMYSNGCDFGTGPLASPFTYYNAFLAKYAPDGTLQWVKTGGGDYDEVAWALTTDNAGKIYISGEFNANATFDSFSVTTGGSADIFVACYDDAGAVQWVTRAGGAHGDRARGIGTDGTNVYITGQFSFAAAFGAQTIMAADTSDVFMARLNPDGNFLWAMPVTGVADSLEPLGYESGNGIAADANGFVYATGAVLDGGVFGSTTYDELGRTDIFVTKISQAGVSVPEEQTPVISLYPNPTKGMLTVTARLEESTDICIHNCLGQKIYSRQTTGLRSLTMDLSAFEKGIYYMEVRTGTSLYREKIVLQ